MAARPANFAIDSISQSAEALARAIEAVIDDSADPVEAVHELRVSIRRVRSDLRVFAPVFESRWIDVVRERLRAIADVVGDTRDNDVMLGRLREVATIVPKSDRASVTVLLTQIDRDRDASFRRMLETLHEPQVKALVADLASPERAADAEDVGVDDLVAATRRQWRRLRKAVRAVDDGDEKQLHKVRIRAKTLRYSLDTLQPLLHRSAPRHAERLVELQDQLGELQDAEVLERRLRRELGRHGDDFVIGELVGIERARKERVRLQWRAQWERASRRRLRRWMR